MIREVVIPIAVVFVVCAAYGASVYAGADLVDAHITAALGMFVLYITH